MKEPFSRLETLTEIVSNCGANTVIFATTGETAREMLLLDRNDLRLFPCVGAMGHVSSMAFAYALSSGKKVICLDGDGSLLMHMGAMPSISFSKNINFIHILFDNASHLSVGGNPTSGMHLDYTQVAQSLGYENYRKIVNLSEIREILELHRNKPTLTSFCQIKTSQNKTPKLPRPENLLFYKERLLQG